MERSPFNAFKNHVKLEKLHGIRFIGSYENETACKNCISLISEYLLEEGVKKKLHLAHIIAIFCDGSADNSITQQEVWYVIYTDPETFKPTTEFFEVAAPSYNQDTPDLKQAIFAIFRKNMLELVLKKIVFLASDGASVNCDKDSHLIRLI